MLYGLETVSLRKRQESELEVAELKMLRELAAQSTTPAWDTPSSTWDNLDPSPLIVVSVCKGNPHLLHFCRIYSQKFHF
ncbi:hypothetical protein QTP70_006050 [Hemibagrus guttatus]|uniref:Uncharacterized protein n=1 Tax=Hemibagrus guttatus TaxID=175788 RepID=A0AAE0RHK5_9TELE|nr:hypothetical protein QTP70_006050 [Hemibagrus guttatus]